MKTFYTSILILLIATFLSTLSLNNARRFHPDEAFYMTFARNAAVNGDWLMVSEPVDKPPLTFYANAISLKFLAVESDENGVLQLDTLKGEFAGRIPSVLMSVILVAVVMALAKSLYKPLPLTPSPLSSEGEQSTSRLIMRKVDNQVAYLTGLFATLSPFRIVFAATAFTDLPMLLFATISLWMAAKGKWGWSAFWFIVSIWAKPQSIFYLPLIVILLIVLEYKADTIHRVPTIILRFIFPIIIGGLLLWGWDMARIAQGAESFFALGQSRYTATMITPLENYISRFAEWWATVQYLFGNGLLTAIFLTIGILGAIRRQNVINLILVGWLITFSMAHIIFTLNLFDRNLIVLLPVAVIFVAKEFQSQKNDQLEKSRREESQTLLYINIKRVFIIILLCYLGLLSIQASLQQHPIGGDDGRHDGINDLADYLNSKPVATVIYDPWLDWELDYYMGVWTNKRRVFYPTPELLITDALALDEVGMRYFVVPATIDETDWLNALDKAGFTITLDYEMSNFRIWAIMPP